MAVDDDRWRSAPLSVFASDVLGSACTIWHQASSKHSRLLDQKPVRPADALDAQFEADALAYRAASASLFEIQKSMAAPRQPLSRPDLDALEDRARDVLESTALMAMRAQALIAAVLTAPAEHPERADLDSDVAKLSWWFEKLSALLGEVPADTPELAIRARTGEAAGRVGLSRDEAWARVPRRWRE